MSFKSAVERITDNHFVLPKVGGMKAEVHAFLTEALHEASEEKVWQQIAHGASYEGVIGAYLMPDTHPGYGVPVGSVIVTDDTIIQGGSGYDISCGVLYMKAELTAAAVKSKHKRERWVKEVERRVATGKGHHRPDLMPKFSRAQADDILRFGAKALGVRADLCERQYIPVPEDVDLARVEGANVRGLPSNRREDSWLRAGEPLGKEYWAHHNSAANFAVANRHIIVDGIQAATEEVFGAGVEVYYEISHNLVQQETIVLPDGIFQQRIDDEMASVQRTFAGVSVEGIVGNHEHVPLDECAHVYKNLDEVLGVLEAEGIAKVTNRLYPVANIKGTD